MRGNRQTQVNLENGCQNGGGGGKSETAGIRVQEDQLDQITEWAVFNIPRNALLNTVEKQRTAGKQHYTYIRMIYKW